MTLPLNLWIEKHFDDANNYTTPALDAMMADLASITNDEHRVIDRAGLDKRLNEVIKRKKLRVATNKAFDAGARNLPMFPSLTVEGRRMRVDYRTFTREQLSVLITDEEKHLRENEAVLVGHRVDAERFAKHPSLTTLQEVWDAEGVEYEVVLPLAANE